MSSVTCGRFTYESDNIINVCNRFSTLCFEDLTESLVRAKMQTLDEDWQSLRRAYEDVYSSEDGVVGEDFKKDARSKYESCRDIYQQTKADMVDFIKCSEISTENEQRKIDPQFLSK